MYISNKSPAKIFASSPPAAPRISTITFLSSLGSLGINKILISSRKVINDIEIIDNPIKSKVTIGNI